MSCARISSTANKPAPITGSLARGLPSLVEWRCISCGHVWRNGPAPSHCWACGLSRGYAPEPIELQGTVSDELGALPTGPVLPEWAEMFPGGIPTGRSFVLRGRPGAGKSRVSYRLASQLGIAAVFGLEMGKTLSLETARKAGAKTENLLWYDDIEGIADLERFTPNCVVIDSLQKLGRRRASVVNRLREWAERTQGTLIVVSQLGIKGSSRHGEDQDFDCDCLLDVSKTTTEKGLRKEIHGTEESPSDCKAAHAHVYAAKSRLCPLVAIDIPIVG